MGVGDSAEGIVLIHPLGRERLLVLSCSLMSHPPKILFFCPLGDDRVFVSVFYTAVAKYIVSRSLMGARHKSPAVE